jgi:hypothetical protein
MYLFKIVAIAAARKLKAKPSTLWKYNNPNQNAIHNSQVKGFTLNLQVKFLTNITPAEAMPQISIKVFSIFLFV